MTVDLLGCSDVTSTASVGSIFFGAIKYEQEFQNRVEDVE